MITLSFRQVWGTASENLWTYLDDKIKVPILFLLKKSKKKELFFSLFLSFTFVFHFFLMFIHILFLSPGFPSPSFYYVHFLFLTIALTLSNLFLSFQLSFSVLLFFLSSVLSFIYFFISSLTNLVSSFPFHSYPTLLFHCWWKLITLYLCINNWVQIFIVFINSSHKANYFHLIE